VTGPARIVSTLVVIAYGCAWLVPCVGLVDWPARDSRHHSVAGHADHGSEPGRLEAGELARSVDVPETVVVERGVRAPCACGCEDAPHASGSGGRIGYGIALAALSAPEDHTLPRKLTRAVRGARTALHPIDHVPIHS